MANIFPSYLRLNRTSYVYYIFELPTLQKYYNAITIFERSFTTRS